ncbi:MAG: sensor domain-containing diguanylate cyclase [Rhodocyclales bacterium]|nr:sensor domain-containing diguanylate cyclase [Rhodocyclales bacterium]
MRLLDKILLVSAIILAALVTVLTVLSALALRQFSLYTAERHARSVAETVKVGLTESMINGTIKKRQQFLVRMSGIPGVNEVRVARGPAVISQFGPGLASEDAVHHDVREVLATGHEVFEVVETNGELIFHAVIPYIASDQGVPNCLQCHLVKAGTVLGTVTVDIPFTEVRNQGIVAVALVSLAVLVAALVALALLRRMMRPLSETAQAVQEVTSQAVEGNFAGRVLRRSSDEVGDIAVNINHLMEFLQREVSTIRNRVGELMGFQIKENGNQLVNTTELVESLVEASQFKQAIEEDQTKAEIYRRLADMLQKKYAVTRFSIYEVASSKNRMTAMSIDGDANATCRYCDPQVMVDANFCRARRTGHEVNAFTFPGLCTMFRPGAEGDTHVCLPINQSGSAGAIVQILAAREDGDLASLLVPFVSVYLREAGPVLEAKRLMEHLRENSLRDPMTGLYNRRFLEDYVGALVSSSQRRKSAFAVLMLDLDFFKQVNDTHGHEAGDKVIKTLADILMRSVRSSDIAVRYGGEEFLLVLTDTGIEPALKVAEKIRAEVEATKVPLPSGILQKTISIGVAEFPTDADTFWQVVKYADVALYKAKAGGRNRVARFLPEMWDASGSY